MSLLTSGQVGNIGLNHMKAVRQETQDDTITPRRRE